MKVKAVIWRPDRTNDVHTPKRKEIQGNTFRYQDFTYFIHPDRQMVTWTRGPWWKLWQRQYFATYYYKHGMAQALPVPDFEAVEEVVLDTQGKPVYNGNGKPKTHQVFPKVVDNGIASEELAAIFNPWFYRIIGNSASQKMVNIQFWLTIGIAVGIVYIGWQISQLPDLIADKINIVVQQAQQASQDIVTNNQSTSGGGK